MRILIPTAGTRGDIQPYLALAGELQQHGHEPMIATDREQICSENGLVETVRLIESLQI